MLIRTVGKDIALLGQNERGHLYSVYVLLEKYLGVRFLAWDCTVVPKPIRADAAGAGLLLRAAVHVPRNALLRLVPQRNRRTAAAERSIHQVRRERRAARSTSSPTSTPSTTSFPRRSISRTIRSTTACRAASGSPERVHAQLCLTNPDVLRIAKEKVLKWIDEHPDVPIIDVSQNDGNGACECDEVHGHRQGRRLAARADPAIRERHRRRGGEEASGQVD